MTPNDFDYLWKKYIKPLKGKKVYTIEEKKENFICEVTDDYLVRISSNGKKSARISKIIFENIYTRVSKDKHLSRAFVDENYKGRRSSIICAILCELPNVTFTTNPIQLHLQDDDTNQAKHAI